MYQKKRCCKSILTNFFFITLFLKRSLKVIIAEIVWISYYEAFYLKFRHSRGANMISFLKMRFHTYVIHPVPLCIAVWVFTNYTYFVSTLMRLSWVGLGPCAQLSCHSSRKVHVPLFDAALPGHNQNYGIFFMLTIIIVMICNALFEWMGGTALFDAAYFLVVHNIIFTDRTG